MLGRFICSYISNKLLSFFVLVFYSVWAWMHRHRIKATTAMYKDVFMQLHKLLFRNLYLSLNISECNHNVIWVTNPCLVTWAVQNMEAHTNCMTKHNIFLILMCKQVLYTHRMHICSQLSPGLDQVTGTKRVGTVNCTSVPMPSLLFPRFWTLEINLLDWTVVLWNLAIL